MNASGTLVKRARYLEEKAADIRTEILKMIHNAQSGHPGGSLSATDIMAALYFDILNINPDKPEWEDRDRFVLSKGHACPVLYATLALRGYYPVEELSTLRQFETRLQGHPVQGKCPGVDATSGSLGIGFGQAVGMALDSRLSGKNFNVYTILGDGETNEGIVWEAANTAHKFRLDNLVAVVDRNNLQNDGSAEGAWVHAYLHRVEGDDSNAGYWYRRAGKPHCRDSLETEWAEISVALLHSAPL